MIKITFFPNGEEGEPGPVIQFTLTTKEDLIRIHELFDDLSKKDNHQILIDGSSEDYNLDGKIKSFSFSSLSGGVDLLRKSLFGKFSIGLDKKYWIEIMKMIKSLSESSNGFIYLDEFKNLNKLHEDATIIISKKIIL